MNTVSGVVDADQVKADGDKSFGRSNDGPFTVGVVWVRAGIAGAGEGAAVSLKSSPTARG